MAKLYYENDANPSLVRSRKVASSDTARRAMRTR